MIKILFCRLPVFKPQTAKMRQSYRCFTIIEFLTVIAMISTLAALNRARRKVKQVNYGIKRFVVQGQMTARASACIPAPICPVDHYFRRDQLRSQRKISVWNHNVCQITIKQSTP